EQTRGNHCRSSEPHTGRDGVPRLSFETSFASGRLRMGRGLGEPLGGALGWQQMVWEGDLADALSVLSGDTAASIKGDQDVGPMVLHQSRMCGRVRRSDRLFLWVGWFLVSRVRVFLLHWAASGGRALGSGALHLRF